MELCRFHDPKVFVGKPCSVCKKRGRTAEKASFLPTGEVGSWNGNDINIPQVMFCLVKGDKSRCGDAENIADPVQVFSGLKLRG
jgi:hypothetical protein